MTPYHRQENYTVDGNAIAEADGTGKGPYEVKRSQSQSEFGDSLYSAVTTKPVGSGGKIRKRKSGSNRREFTAVCISYVVLFSDLKYSE